MELLSSGEKLKKIRKKHKITQKELVRGITTTATLSYIENNKFNISEELALKLCERLNAFSVDSKNLIEPKELFKSKKQLEEEYVNHYLKKINKMKVEKLHKVLAPFNDSDNYYQKNRLFFVAAAYLFKKNWSYSRKLFEEVVDISIFNNYKFSNATILFLQRIYIQTDLNACQNLYKNYKHHLLQGDYPVKGFVLYNFGVTFLRLEEYKTAYLLFYSSLQLKTSDNVNEWGMNNLVLCQLKLKKYNEALDFCSKLLNKTSNDFIKKNCYSNLLSIGIRTKDSFLIENNIVKLVNHIEKLEESFKHQGYFSIAKGYSFLGDRLNSGRFFLKELQLGYKIKNSHFDFNVYEVCIENLLEVYLDLDIKELKNLEKHIFEIPYENLSKQLLSKIIHKYKASYPLAAFNIFLKNLISI